MSDRLKTLSRRDLNRMSIAAATVALVGCGDQESTNRTSASETAVARPRPTSTKPPLAPTPGPESQRIIDQAAREQIGSRLQREPRLILIGKVGEVLAGALPETFAEAEKLTDKLNNYPIAVYRNSEGRAVEPLIAILPENGHYARLRGEVVLSDRMFSYSSEDQVMIMLKELAKFDGLHRLLLEYIGKPAVDSTNRELGQRQFQEYNLHVARGHFRICEQIESLQQLANIQNSVLLREYSKPFPQSNDSVLSGYQEAKDEPQKHQSPQWQQLMTRLRNTPGHFTY